MAKFQYKASLQPLYGIFEGVFVYVKTLCNIWVKLATYK